MSQAQRVAEIIAEAEQAWQRLPEHYHEAGAAWTRADPHVVAHEIRRAAGRKRRFLEWGSGIGTHCLIADACGMEAHGIEINGVLIDAARELAGRLDARTVYGEGTFIPEFTAMPPPDDDADDLLWGGGLDGYKTLVDQLGMAQRPDGQNLVARPKSIVETYDVIFAYPAPQHVDWFARLFRDLAREGAVFWCYTETAGILESIKLSGCMTTPLRPA